MSQDISKFGFKPVDEIPVKENDWPAMIRMFLASEDKIICREFDSNKKASSIASSIRKSIGKMGATDKVNVTVSDGKIYVSKA